MVLPKVSREYRSQGSGYRALKLQESTVSQPQDSEVLIKVHAVSLIFRDLLVTNGAFPGTKENVVPCSDMAGEIVAVGSKVSAWAVGDRVCADFTLDHTHGEITPQAQATCLGGPIDGVLTEYITVPAHSLVRIPEHLSYEEGSTLPCAAVTAYNGLTGPRPVKGGDWVLVLGTGGVSMFALQFAVASGANVIVTSSSDEKLKLATKLGARHVVNYKTTPKWDEEVLKLTNGKGVDHVIETGGSGTVEKSVGAVSYGGYIHIIGAVSGGDAAIPIFPTIFKAINYRGIQIGSVEKFEEMNRLIEARQIHPVIDKVFSFENAPDAFAHLESQKHVGKVVIKVA
ncbi:NAD(P)-binding protein [Coniophora puteana RWD-64-598 SS2]|uniref:NAD(P)-binding protein n=1 Tax=Coniophora puteana (strain RWD-64-598) TaxID=741705 RepID=A0A5M3MC45_CONPW|nr:NAD(P)-binding protein [Coniophora puteana RWD-64-598 SS2]EIW76606.1 NAD(P)-binding protein [Coniophora puteana RWD-64-598 SS2]